MSEEKKIIIDEDWKSRVAAEKEALENAAQGHSPSPGGTATEAASPLAGDAQFPPASFETLVASLATEAMIGLGQLPHPLTGKLEASPAGARYAIDLLEIIEEKTAGNLSPDEDRGLKELLHQLRMAFVATQATAK